MKPAEPYDETGHLAARGGRDYSLGHQRMYRGPAQLLAGAGASVLDVGFGIGFGLVQLSAEKVFAHYCGLEIDRKCYDHVRPRWEGVAAVELHCADFLAWPDERAWDHAFCIEVFEHVDPARAREFLGRLRRRTRTLWLSTPEADRSPHGLYTRLQLRGLLADAGFANVTVLAEQWTTLYLAQ